MPLNYVDIGEKNDLFCIDALAELKGDPEINKPHQKKKAAKYQLAENATCSRAPLRGGRPRVRGLLMGYVEVEGD